MSILHPASIDEHHGLVLSGYQEIKRKAPEGIADIQNILTRCRKLQSFLFVGSAGFLVAEPVHPDTLFIPLAYARKKHCIQQYMPFVMNLARSINLSKIAWISPRKGWIKAVKHLNPTEQDGKITIEVTHEWRRK